LPIFPLSFCVPLDTFSFLFFSSNLFQLGIKSTAYAK
jgi:hypothetical protein